MAGRRKSTEATSAASIDAPATADGSRPFTIYLSSTFDDMVNERKAAIDVLHDQNVVVDSCRAGSKPLVEHCVADVRRCDLYIVIIGLRYGHEPPTEANPRGLSISELEYEACSMPGQRSIPRLVFLRQTNEVKYSDRQQDNVNRFRDRASNRSEATPFPFDTIPQLREGLLKAVARERVRLRAEESGTASIFQGRQQRSDALSQVSLAVLRGTDDRFLQRLGADPRFHIFDVSPTDERFLFRLDVGLRRGQQGCLMISSEGLKRLTSDGAHLQRIEAALDMYARQGRSPTLVLVGVSRQALPAAWLPVNHFSCSARALEADRLDCTLSELHRHLRTLHPELTPEARVALPYVVIAPTAQEAESIVDGDSRVLDAIADEDERQACSNALQQVAAASRKLLPAWPLKYYGQTRENWLCFGNGECAIGDLIVQGIAKLNEAAPGSRERKLLMDTNVVPRPYKLEALLDDKFGSANAALDAVAAGGLVIIDELALVHPRLRAVAERLLSGKRTAVVTISACDPAHSPTAWLLRRNSFLRVGTLVTRYVDDLDPRCEIAVNNAHRLRRWLSIAIPDLVSLGDASQAMPSLVKRADGLLT